MRGGLCPALGGGVLLGHSCQFLPPPLTPSGSRKAFFLLRVTLGIPPLSGAWFNMEESSPSHRIRGGRAGVLISHNELREVQGLVQSHTAKWKSHPGKQIPLLSHVYQPSISGGGGWGVQNCACLSKLCNSSTQNNI